MNKINFEQKNRVFNVTSHMIINFNDFQSIGTQRITQKKTVLRKKRHFQTFSRIANNFP